MATVKYKDSEGNWQLASSVIIDTGSGGGITPTGAIEITENGTHDVTEYATAEVNVPTGGGGGVFIPVHFYCNQGASSSNGSYKTYYNIPLDGKTNSIKITFTAYGNSTSTNSLRWQIGYKKGLMRYGYREPAYNYVDENYDTSFTYPMGSSNTYLHSTIKTEPVTKVFEITGLLGYHALHFEIDGLYTYSSTLAYGALDIENLEFN